MAHRDPIEEVLYRTAEIARNSHYGWARRQSTRLLVATSRERLLMALAQDDDLRARVRTYMVKNQRRALEPIVFADDADLFEREMVRTHGALRTLATGLLHEDSEVVHLAVDHLKGGPKTELPAPDSDQNSDPTPTAIPTLDPSDASASTIEVEQLEARLEELLDELDSVQKERESSTARAEMAEDTLAQLRVEADRAKAHAARAEAELDDLRSSIPSKRQQRRRDSKLRQAEKYVQERDDLRARTKAAEEARREAIKEAAAIRAEADEAETELREKLRRHKRARISMEQRLETSTGRAEYLSRNIASEIMDLEQQLSQFSHGQAKTRAAKRVQQLQQLQDLLRDAYLTEAEIPAEPKESHLQVLTDRTVRVSPLGGGIEIGGSAILVEGGGIRVLVDAGLRPQADRMDDMAPPRIEEALQRRLDAVFVTHAHTDHSGFVPAVVSRQPGVKVIASPGTSALLPTMWDDSQKVSERRAADLSQFIDAAPVYGEAEVEAAEDRMESVGFGQRKALGKAQFELFPAGHIVGAAGVVLQFGDRRVVVTGDISYEYQATVDGAIIPQSAREADLLVIESTYCHDVRPPREALATNFIKGIEGVLERHGRVLIPAFGLGRAQEVALLLKERLSDTPVLIDGLAGRIGRIFEDFAAAEGRRLEIFGDNVRQIENRRQREREAKTFSTGVVITTSGMMTGGPAIRWAQEILPDRLSALFLCGYQDEESPGSRLLSLANGSGERTISLPGIDGQIEVRVNAEVAMYHLSAHADRDGLTDLIREVSPHDTMLVHGYPFKQRGFASRLKDQRVRVVDTADWSAQ